MWILRWVGHPCGLPDPGGSAQCSRAGSCCALPLIGPQKSGCASCALAGCRQQQRCPARLTVQTGVVSDAAQAAPFPRHTALQALPFQASHSLRRVKNVVSGRCRGPRHTREPPAGCAGNSISFRAGPSGSMLRGTPDNHKFCSAALTATASHALEVKSFFTTLLRQLAPLHHMLQCTA